MRLLFVSSNRLKRVMPPMPLGLASVIGQLDESKHDIRVLDLMFSDQPHADTQSTLSDFDPDVVAISIRNLDNQSYLRTEYLLPAEKDLVEMCRRHSDASIAIGGPAFTVSPIAIFEYLQPDFGIAGEGEIVFPQLVKRIEEAGDWSDLPGLVWGSAGGVRANPPRHIEDLNSLRMPRRDLFDNQRYATEGGAANVLIKQGCIFRCLYCDSPHTLGPRWRMKSPEKVADELESLEKDIGASVVFFTDAIFNRPPEYAEEICRAILRRKLKLNWVAAVLHPAFIEKRGVQLMWEAGCRVVTPGCDTCSDRMLKVLRKDFTKEQLRTALDILEDMQLNYVLSVLFGGPGEDRSTVEETVDFLRERRPLMLDFGVGIRLMPHSRLADIAVQEGVISADDPLMEPRFYVSPQIIDWVEDYLVDVCSERPNWTVAYE
jgi:radical SAM superfamily enzyme YgiQ (UPF0313 family)